VERRSTVGEGTPIKAANAAPRKHTAEKEVFFPEKTSKPALQKGSSMKDMGGVRVMPTEMSRRPLKDSRDRGQTLPSKMVRILKFIYLWQISQKTHPLNTHSNQLIIITTGKFSFRYFSDYEGMRKSESKERR
jgi:hypothetical protein